MKKELFLQHKDRLVEAMKKNPRKAKNVMREMPSPDDKDRNEARCCLCVIQDELEEDSCRARKLSNEESSVFHPESKAKDIFEDKSISFVVFTKSHNRPIKEEVFSAIGLNDEVDLPHSLIAECLDQLLEKEKRFSFFINYPQGRHCSPVEIIRAGTPLTLEEMEHWLDQNKPDHT